MTMLVEWLNMGGYAPYVWSAYGLVLGGLLLQLWSLRRLKKQGQKQLQQWFNR